MSRAEIIYALVVLLVGLPAARFNLTAAALILTYAFMQGSYYIFHLVYPVWVSILSDCAVIAVIYCKPPARDCWPYPDWRAQLCAFWLELSLWDRLVLVLFQIGWLCYATLADAWWPLYWISLAQLIAAGMEALEPHRARLAKRASTPENPSSGLMFVPGRRYRGYE